jgi:hypothetical protein
MAKANSGPDGKPAIVVGEGSEVSALIAEGETDDKRL